MRRQETLLISDILGDVLKENHIDTRLYEMQIIDAWYKTLGTTVKKYTTDIYVRDKKLCIRLSSSILKNDLMMARTNLVTALNKEVGKEIINEIIFL